MKVLVINFNSGSAGPRIANELVKSLNDGGNLAGFIRSSQADAGLPKGIDEKLIISLKTLRGKLGFIRRVLSIYSLLKQVGRVYSEVLPDTVMFPMQQALDPFVLPYVRRISRKNNCRVVVWIHDFQAHPGDFRFLDKILKLVAFKNATHLVALSQGVADKLQCIVKLPVIRLTLPLAIRTHSSNSIDKEGVINLLFFGRMRKYKGIKRLASVWNNYLVNDTSWRLTIAGQGSEKLIRKFFSEGPRCELILRYLTDEEIDGLFSDSTIILLPYDEASQSGVINQALEYGKPYVVTPIPGLVNQLHKLGGGIAASDMSPEAFVNAINDSLKTHSAPGKSDFLEYGWGNQVQQLLNKLI